MLLLPTSDQSANPESILGSSLSGPDLSYSLSDLSLLCARSDCSSIQDVECPLQRFLSNAIYSHCFASPLSSTQDNRSRALLLSSSIPHAGAWLQAVPSSSLGLLFPDIEFRLSLKYWLGVPLYSEDSVCLVCSTLVTIKCHVEATKTGSIIMMP